MRLALVACPRFEEGGLRWIESLRARHDPQASRIGAHFTLVFPAALAVDTVTEHVRTLLPGRGPIAFIARHAEAVPDPMGGGGHVFLVPEEGRLEIVLLHDRLYEGPLRPHLRADLPFVPHITIGGCNDLRHCRELAAELNGAPFALRGLIQSLDLVEAGGETVTRLMSFALEERTATRARR